MKSISIIFLFTAIVQSSFAAEFANNRINSEDLPPQTNDVRNLSSEMIQLGDELEKAFHDKTNPERIKDLVAKGAPVNFRLNYGLEIRKEADFVAAFRLMLQGDKGKENILSNAKILLSDNHQAEQLAAYVSTAQEIFNILYSPNANQDDVPLSEDFGEFILNKPFDARFDPQQQNGSLIIAAGIRDSILLTDVIQGGKNYTREDSDNGASVHFQGYFGDTAAVWSAILLDAKNLSILLGQGAKMEKLGVTEASLLHWVVLAARLDNTKERQEKARACLEVLLSHNIDIHALNKIGFSALDYGDKLTNSIIEAKF